MEHEYGDLLYHTEVRWLSRGRVLSRICDLLEEISLFLDMNGEPVAELADIKRKYDVAFMADITEFLNNLNATFQGKNKLISVQINVLYYSSFQK